MQCAETSASRGVVTIPLPRAGRPDTGDRAWVVVTRTGRLSGTLSGPRRSIDQARHRSVDRAFGAARAGCGSVVAGTTTCNRGHVGEGGAQVASLAD